MPNNCGDELLRYCREASTDIVLVSPYIKEAALKRVLENIDQNVRVTCVTRWKATDIYLGASDIGVFDLIQDFPSASLKHHPRLHAKYYRCDSIILIGSANLTPSGLGWVGSNSNLEILEVVDKESSKLHDFESQLLNESFYIDERTKKLIQEQVDSIKVSLPSEGHLLESLDTPIPNMWLPRTRNLYDLKKVYDSKSDDELKDVITPTIESAKWDLGALDFPEQLSDDDFWAKLSDSFSSHPMMRWIRENSRGEGIYQTQAEEAIHDYIGIGGSDALEDTWSASDYWETLKIWSEALFPNEYRREPVEEKFIKSSTIN